MTSSTAVIELTDFGQADRAIATSSGKPHQNPNELDRRPSNFAGDGATLELAIEEAERWNKPKMNVARLGAAFWGFIIMGANDAAVGALIPYLETYYHITYTVVALLFLSPLFGYTAAALLNDRVHHYFGQRGVGIISATCHLIAYTVASLHPPFPVFVVIYVVAGLGNGLEDAAWNAWVSNMANTNEVMGILHACYGLGATISPLVATSMITKANLPWYTYYYLMIGFSVLELVANTLSFWKITGKTFRQAHPRPTEKKGPPIKEALFTLPAARTSWILPAFLFVYMGVEVALGGWITTFMLTVRHGSAFASGMAATGFWLGMTVGRVVLGFVTPKIGERLSVMIYIPLAMGLELLFWLVPQFHVSAVAVGLIGFFIGPLFPAAVVEATKLLPRHLHVFVIGFGAAIGGGGASVFPFAVGAIAQSSSKGVQVLQPIVLALLAALLILWLCLPKVQKKRD